MIIEILENELVINTISADESFAEAIYPGAWRVANLQPVPETFELVAQNHITQLAFLNRFTDAEAIGIDLVSQGNTVNAAAMRRFQKKVDAATFIDLDRTDTRMGVQTLEALGLLAVGRATIILDTQIDNSERYVK